MNYEYLQEFWLYEIKTYNNNLSKIQLGLKNSLCECKVMQLLSTYRLRLSLFGYKYIMKMMDVNRLCAKTARMHHRRLLSVANTSSAWAKGVGAEELIGLF